MFSTATISVFGSYIRVTLTLPPDNIESMCMNVRVGTNDFTKNKDLCNDCSLSAINLQSCSSSGSSSSSKSSSSKSKSSCDSYLKKIIKLIAWGLLVCFVIYLIKNKCQIGSLMCLDTSNCFTFNSIFNNKTEEKNEENKKD